MKRLRLLPIIFLLALLAGCLPALNLNSETMTDGDVTVYHHWKNYDYLNSYGAIRVKPAGKTLHIDFQTEINGGSLELKVFGPDGKPLWTAKTTNSGLYSADIPIEKHDKYRIAIRARHTSGSYDVKYHFVE